MADSPKLKLTDLPNKTNWVERTGALGGPTNWIKRAAEHIHAKGHSTGTSIAFAVNAARKLCASGDLQFKGIQQANPGSRAEACAAVAKWDAARARAKATKDMSAQAAFRAIDLAGKPRVAKGTVIDLATATPLDLAKSEQQVLEDRILAALRKRPELKGKSDKALRAAARKAATEGLARRRARQQLGIKDVRNASPAQQKALAKAGLLGRSGKVGTVVQHKLLKGPRKGQTITVKLGKGGWHEVKSRAGQKVVTV